MDQKNRIEKAYQLDAIPVDEHSKAKSDCKNITSFIATDTTTALGSLLKTGNVNGYRKAARFLLLLGKREASNVLKNFSPLEIEKLTKEIASIKQINNKEAAKILNEFGYLSPESSNRKHSSSPPSGGIEVAKKMLISAFGDKKGSAILKKVIPFNGENPFSFLEDLEFQQLTMILRKEPVHVLTVILSFLDTVKASKILESLPPDIQTTIIARMAAMEKITPEVIMSMEKVLIKRIKNQSKVITEQIDGQSVLAEILKNMALSDEGRILNNIADTDEVLSESIREKLFTVETILFVKDTDLERILRDFSDTEIAILLKGRNKDLYNKIIFNVSKRRIKFIADEKKTIGPIPKSDVDDAMKEFLDYLKDQEIQGKIVLSRAKEEYI